MIALLAKLLVLVCLVFASCGCRVRCTQRARPSAPHMRNLTPEQLEEVLAVDKKEEEEHRLQFMRSLLVAASRGFALLAREGPYAEQSNTLAVLLADMGTIVGRAEWKKLPVRAHNTRELLLAGAQLMQEYRRPKGHRDIQVGETRVLARDIGDTLEQLAWEEQTGLDAWEEAP